MKYEYCMANRAYKYAQTKEWAKKRMKEAIEIRFKILFGKSNYGGRKTMSQNYECEYPPEWDLPEEPEQELELRVCCQDIIEEQAIPVAERCQGEFMKRIITTGVDRSEEFYCCTECGALLTEEELITMACETYGDKWQEWYYKPKVPESTESWDFTNHEDVPLFDRDTSDWEYNQQYK